MCIRDSIMALSKPTRTHYKSLTFAEKVAVIREVEKGQKNASQWAPHPVSYTHLDVYKRQELFIFLDFDQVFTS